MGESERVRPYYDPEKGYYARLKALLEAFNKEFPWRIIPNEAPCQEQESHHTTLTTP